MSISAKKLVAGVSFLAILFFISNFLVAQNIPGSVYVKLDPGFQSSMSAYRMVSNDQNKILTGNPDIDQLFSQFDVNRMQRVFPYAGKFEKKHQKWGLHLWYKLELSSQELKFTQSFQQALSNYSEIQIAELIREKKINDGANQELIVEHDSKKLFTGNNDFNDPLLQDQWHYHNTGQTGGSTGADIDLFSAWNIQTGDSSVIVAIIDGGVDFNHEDLSANMWLNVEEINGVSGVDDDANGYVDDFHGYNFADNNQVIPGNHGTHVAGTVAAVNNNGVGVAGVAGGNGTGNGVRLMSAQTFGSSLGGFPEAFVYAADNGAVIAQNSWGYTSPGYYETVVLEAIDYFIANAGYDADDNPVGPMQGGLVIFSSGNDNSDNDYYPGYYEPVLSVASTNHNDIKAWYSNYGDWVDVSAPGGETSVQNQGVLSTLPNNTYGFYQGTSMACPHTSGVAALIVSQYPGITPLEVWNRLTFTANNIDSLNSTYYGQLGSGRINAFSSIIIADSIAPYPIEDLSIEQLTFNTARITWTATNNFKNGRPISGYDIRYSTNQINEDNFDNAIRYNFNNIPVDSALTESFELTGLESSSEYYVAIKPISYFGQTSSISNVINFTTSEPPVINVQPLSISDTLFNGDSAVHSLVISNSGPSDLLYSIGNSNQEQFSLPGGKYLAFNPDSPTQKTTKEISLNPLNLSLSDLSNTSILALFNSNVYSAYINDLENRGATVTVKNNLVEQDLVDADVLIFDDDIAILNSAMLTSINNWIREGGLIISQADNSDSYVNAVISGSTLHVIDQSFRSILVNDFTSHPINNDVNQMQWYSYGSRLEVGDNSEILMYDNLNNVVGAATTFELGKIIVLGNEAFSNEHYNLYDTRVFAQQSIDWLINGSSKTWYSSDKQEGVVQQNQSDTISVLLSAKGVVPNTYTTELDIFSNDPDNDQISVDIELLVKGAPDLVLNKENIDFGDVYSNYLYSDTVVLTNEGYDTLIINNFTSSSSGITVRNEIDTLLPKETESIIIDLQNSNSGILSADIEISSNNYLSNSQIITVEGNVIDPPVINVSTDTLYAELFNGGESEVSFDISNIGSSNLHVNYIIEQRAYSQNEATVLFQSQSFEYPSFVLKSKNEEAPVIDFEKIRYHTQKKDIPATKISDFAFNDLLSKVENHYQSITSNIPNIFYFSEGDSLSSISDGGNDMYDGGNRLNTEYGLLNYTGSAIVQSAVLGPSGEYFTSKNDGLFVFAGNNMEVSEFIISGNLGADGSGNVDGSVLELNYNGIRYLGFIKRVYNAYDPSVNHLIIVEDTGGPSHEFDTYSDNDYHKVFDIDSNNNLYYLLFAGTNGHYYDNSVFENVMRSFLSLLSTENWLSISPEFDTIPASSSSTHQALFQSGGMEPGLYVADVQIFSNDSLNKRIVIPASLQVNASPYIISDTSLLSYGEVFLNDTSLLALTLTNAGNEPLLISDIISSQNEFFVDVNPFPLQPGKDSIINIGFSPSSEQIYNGYIRFSTNDPNRNSFEISLSGTGVLPPEMRIEPDTINIQLNAGSSDQRSIVVHNDGHSNLYWNAKMRSITSVSQSSNAEGLTTKNGEFILLEDSPVRFTSIVYNEENNSLYGLQVNGNGFYRYSFSDSTWIRLDNSPRYNYNAVGGVLLDNKLYFFYSSNSYATVYDLQLNEWLGTVYLPFNASPGITTDGESIYIGADYNIIEYIPQNDYWNPEINYLRSLPNGYRYMVGLEFYNGKLYGLLENRNNQIGIFDLESQTWDFIVTPERSHYSASLDESTGSYFLLGGEQFNLLYRYEIEQSTWLADTLPPMSLLNSDVEFVHGNNFGLYIAEGELGDQFIKYNPNYTPSWLSLSQDTDTTQAGQEIEIIANVDASNLYDGKYAAKVIFNSNDPVNSQESSFINLSVIGQPDIEIREDSLMFLNTYVGKRDSISFEIHNPGSKYVEVNEMEFLTDYFNVNDYPDSIAPGDSKMVWAYFVPDEAKVFTDTLTIENSSTANSNYKIPVLGVAVDAPVFSVQNDTLKFFAYQDSTITKSFEIENTGGYDLTYYVSDSRFWESNVENHSVIFDSDSSYYSIDSRSGRLKFEWEDISNKGIRLPFTYSDDDRWITLGFNFPFYGVNYSAIRISSNGYLSTNSSAYSNNYQNLPNTNFPNGVIAALWKNLDPTTGSVYYYSDYTTRCIFQYNNVVLQGTQSIQTFQIILESDGAIQLNYLDVNEDYQNHSIGIENHNGQLGMNISYNDTYVEDSLSVHIRPYNDFIMSVDPLYATIMPGQSQDVNVEINTNGLFGGKHYDKVGFFTNNLNNETIDVTFEINVIEAPYISNMPDTIEVLENDTLEHTFEFFDANDLEINYELESLGNSNLPNYEFDQKSGLVKWMPSYDDAGLYQHRIIADNGYLKSNNEFVLKVTDVNRAPQTIQDLSKIYIPERRIRYFALFDYFQDPDGDPINYSVTSDDHSVATVSIIYDSLALSSREFGITTIHIQTRDSKGAFSEFEWLVEVGGVTSLSMGQSEFRLYPNPAKNQVNLIFNEVMNNDLNIQLMDSNGRIFKNWNNINTDHSNKINLQFEFVPEGMYILKVRYEDSVKTIKLIIKQ